MSELTDKQARFSQMLGALLVYAAAMGSPYRVRMDWVYRDKRANAAVGGHSKSLHTQRLAVDLIIDRLVNGKWVYQRKETPFHSFLGDYWKRIGGEWGGDFGDPGHFSLGHKGMK